MLSKNYPKKRFLFVIRNFLSMYMFIQIANIIYSYWEITQPLSQEEIVLSKSWLLTDVSIFVTLVNNDLLLVYASFVINLGSFWIVPIIFLFQGRYIVLGYLIMILSMALTKILNLTLNCMLMMKNKYYKVNWKHELHAWFCK